MFSGDNQALSVKIHKKDENKDNTQDIDEENINSTFDIIKTAQWIKENNYRHVCLQFPDELLKYSSAISFMLRKETEAQIYIIADTTYDSCCVDTISAEHVTGDAIVHYGHTCLSPVDFPVLYIYPKTQLNIERVNELINQSNIQNVVIFYDISFRHLEDELQKILFTHNPDIIIGSFSDKKDDNVIHSRLLVDSKSDIKSPQILKESTIIFIGNDGPTLFNIYITAQAKELYHLDYLSYTLNQYSKSAWFKRRRYIIEKCKDATTIGILVSQLSMPNVNELVQHLRKIIKKSGKKCYTVYVGKPNVAKLANLSEMDLYVLLTCTESKLFDSRDFMTPIMYPFELELALSAKDSYSTSYMTNFKDLVSEEHQQTMKTDDFHAPDVSLITGKMRNVNIPNEDEMSSVENSNSALLKRDKMNIVQYEIGSALTNRTWKGLEPKIGETPVEELTKGLSGIPNGYQSEPKLK